jgi:enoyl-CoA hydratase/carnithine racemase
MSLPVTLDISGPLATLTLNRPDKLNALTHEMGDRVVEAVRTLNANRDVRVLVVRGAGRAFSAGGDLDWLLENARRSEAENRAGMEAFYRKFLSLRELEVPAIAMVHGRATGAGFCFALGCDLRIASHDAIFSANFVRVGLNPGMGGSYTLTQNLGPALASELILTGREVFADEALSLGLISRMVTPEELEATTYALAQQIAANAPVAIRHAKAALRLAQTEELGVVLAREAGGQAECFASQDLLEGVDAARARRAPVFQGH